MRLRRRSSENAAENAAGAGAAAASAGPSDVTPVVHDTEDTVPVDTSALALAPRQASAPKQASAPEPEPESEPVPEPVPEPAPSSEPALASEPGRDATVDAAVDRPASGRSPSRSTSRSTGATLSVEDPEETVRAARRRFVRRQWRRRWLAWRRLVVALFVAGVVAASVWLVFFSPVLAVSGVQVEGTSTVSPAAVRQVADVPRGGPLATADLDAVAARVKDMPAVKDVDVSRAWPDRVRIDVTERQPVAVVEASGQGGSLRATDAEGVLFRSYAARPAGLPLIRTGRHASTDALAEAATVAGSLPRALAARVAAVSVSTVDTIDLRLKSGKRVRWGSADDSVDKARVLAVLLGQKAAYYDVSVPGEPVIRR